MKNLFILTFLCLPHLLFCQSEKEKQKVKSQVETFSERTGTLIQKDVEKIGSTGSIDINIVKLKDHITGDKISGLAFSYHFGDNPPSAILDVGEIDGLITSLTAIKSVVATNKTENTEITYKGRTGLEIGAYFDKDPKSYTGEKKWMYYIKLVESRNSLKPEDFMALCGYIEAAKSKL